METLIGGDTLKINCSVPSRSFNYIPAAVASGKIRLGRVFGTKLKWRRGKVLDLGLSTHLQGE
jgi:hypothetical protein